jgi:adenylate cyclase
MAKILIVDDDKAFIDVIATVLRVKGFDVETQPDSPEFFARMESISDPKDMPSMLLLDINLPTEDGLEITRKIRADSTIGRLPIILMTGGADGDKVRGLQAGADDFITKPFSANELLAKTESLLRIREDELATAQNLSTMKKFVAPQVAKMVVDEKKKGILEIHDEDIAVVFIDLRGFTQFCQMFPNKENLAVLSDFYAVVGKAAIEYGGTLGFLAGDGIMLFFNDPVPIADYQLVATKYTLDVRERLRNLASKWVASGYDLGFGIGLDWGRASIGTIGFADFSQYSVIGNTVNIASRLCDLAQHDEIVITDRSLGTIPSRSAKVQVSKGRSVLLKGLGEQQIWSLDACVDK